VKQGVEVFASLEDAMTHLGAAEGLENVFVIGGGQVPPPSLPPQTPSPLPFSHLDPCQRAQQRIAVTSMNPKPPPIISIISHSAERSVSANLTSHILSKASEKPEAWPEDCRKMFSVCF